MGGAYNTNGRRKIPKRVLNENCYTTIPVGRPRTRLADVV
jgi:hypothetical protein